MADAPHGYCALCQALGKPEVPAIKWEGIPICQACHDETLRQVRANRAAELLAHDPGGASLSSLAELHRPADATVH